MSALRHRRVLPLVLSALLIAIGAGIVGNGFYQRWRSTQDLASRGSADSSALGSWKAGGSANLAGAPVSGTALAAPTPGGCGGGGGSSADAYLLMKFPSLANYGYAGVAVDGNWDNLHDRSMVHWHGSPDPGGTGNMIIAFHREPNYQHIDELVQGGVISIQDRSCHVYTYTVTQRWELSPDRVTQLAPTTGHDLTLVTCTPWWQDYNRYIWRASLTSVDGRPVAA